MTALPTGARRAVPTDGPIVLGVLYPSAWFGDDGDFARAVDAARAVDPRLVVIVESYDEGQHIRTLRGRPEGLDEARRLASPLSERQRAVFEEVHGVLTIDLPFDVGAIAPNLSWVQGVGAGYAQLLSAGIAESRIRLTNSAGANSVAIAEFVLGRLLEERKRFRELARAQVERVWEPRFGAELAGATVGLVGLGAINAQVARLLQAFGCTVLACRRSARAGDASPDFEQLFPTSRLHEMLGRCDTVVAAVPESAETIGLFDAAAFAAMQRGSFFVNVGRGTLVEERALVAALRSGHLRGASLDVQAREPLPADDPLWDAPNLTLSPHCAASPASLFPNVHRLWVENIRRWIDGRPLVNEVDLDTR